MPTPQLTPQTPPTSLVAEFLEIVARFADTLIEMDLTTPEAMTALASLAHAPGFARLAAAALEAWAVEKELLQPVPTHPQAIRAIRDVRWLSSHLDALLSYSLELSSVQESLANLWEDPTFAALFYAAQQAHARRALPL